MSARASMSASEVLQVMFRTSPGDITVWTKDEVRDAIDAYRAEVLSDAAQDLRSQMDPDAPASAALIELLAKRLEA